MIILENEPMSRHTTFRVGGPARYFAEPESEEELLELVGKLRRNNEPFTLLGRGSNLLVSDAGYEGTVIHISEALAGISIEGEFITAGAGATLGSIAAAALGAGLAGFEFAAGIPGTLGGAIIMNAGAYGGEMKDVAAFVRLLDGDGKVITLSGEEMNFRYRGSRAMDEGLTVLSAVLKLEPGDPAAIRERMDELMKKRKDKQPLEYPSAGSTFKRPEGYFAGKLIEDAGLRGYSVGGAQVSEKHCGFVINKGGATAADIMQLCDEVSRRVYGLFGVRLEMEVRRLGF